MTARRGSKGVRVRVLGGFGEVRGSEKQSYLPVSSTGVEMVRVVVVRKTATTMRSRRWSCGMVAAEDLGILREEAAGERE